MTQNEATREFQHYGLQAGYWLRPGGVLEEIKWIYAAAEGNYVSFNRTADAFSRLFQLVRLDPELCLRDVFLLMAQCPLLTVIERLNWGAEYLEEALSVDAKPYTGAYDPEGIEYLELYAHWELNTLTNELETNHRLDFHGVGFERREDRLANYTDRDGNPVVEYAKGSRTPWAIEFTPPGWSPDISLRVNPVVHVEEVDYDTAMLRAGDGPITPVAEYTMAWGYTLGQILDGVLYEISFCGGPERKVEKREELDAISAKVEAAIASDDWSRFEEWDMDGKDAGLEGDGDWSPSRLDAWKTYLERDGMHFISKTPGVMGGSACLRNTRISAWSLVEVRTAGATDARLLRDYPGLIQADLDAAWDSFARNRAEIMDAILANHLA